MTTAVALPSTGAPHSTIDIVDVGHGSCVVVRRGTSVVLIDTGPGGAILEYLRSHDINHIDTVILSHADADHIGGLSAILSQPITVGEILWNGDAIKRSALWFDLVYQLADLDRQGITAARRSTHMGMEIPVGDDDIRVRVLAPGVVLQHLVPGSVDREGRTITSNSASIVVQVFVGDEAVLLVPGDLDDIGFEYLEASDLISSMSSKYVLMPHHGGWCGSVASTKLMIENLIAAAAPSAVLVSNGRKRFGNPRQEVMDAVRRVAPTTKIACTQISEKCSQVDIPRAIPGLGFSAGWARGYSCAGTMRISIGTDLSARMDHEAHDQFILDSVPNHLC